MKFCVVVVFVCVSFSAFSQTLKDLNDSLHYYYGNKDYKRAVSVAEKMVEKANEDFGKEHPAYINTIDNLAILYKEAGQYEKAELLYIEATVILKGIFGENDSNYAGSLNKLIELYRSLEQYNKAEPLLIRLTEIWKNVFGEEHPYYVLSLNKLGVLYYEMGQYKEAEPLLLQAKEISEKKVGETHPDYAASLYNLAKLYRDTEQFKKSETLFIQAKGIWEKTIGENNSRYAGCVSDLALLYKETGQYEKAETLFIQASEIWKKVAGLYHPDFALSLNNLALLYNQWGRYAKAETLFIQAIEIEKKAFRQSHSDFATYLNNFAVLYSDLGQYEKAEPLYIQSAEIRKKAFGENNKYYASSLNNLANLYKQMGLYGKAEPLYLQAEKSFRNSLGESHSDYAISLNNVAAFYSDLGQYEKAESLYIQSATIRKKVFGEIHSAYATSLNNLALLYNQIGKYEKAAQLYTQSKEIRKKVLGENHPEYATSLINLALLYTSTGEYEKSESLMLQAYKVETNNLLGVFSNLSEKEKGNYLSHKLDLNNSNNSVLYNYSKASPSFYQSNYNLQLLLKSLSLASTKNTMDAVRNSADTAVQNLFVNWQINKLLLAKQYSLPIAERRTDIKKMEETAENLEKELTRKSAEYKNQQRAIRVNTREVAGSLQKGEVAIEFVRFSLYNKKWTDSIMYGAYILRKNDSIPVFVSLCEEKQLQKLFDSAGTTATTMVNNFYRGFKVENKNAATLGKELYKLVWQPLEPYLKGATKISYSPAGKLYSIAFHALPIDSATVLMDKYQLQQYTSTRQVVLRNSESKTVKPTSITMFGNASFSIDSLQLTKQKSNQPEKENVSTSIYAPPTRGNSNAVWVDLPGTAEEVNKIKKLFSANKIAAQSFVQTKASEENLKALSGNSPQILHIATHGFFLPEPDKKRKENNISNENTYTLADDPLLRSGLILSGGNYAWSGKTPIDGVEDGIATAYEISQLNLSNTELVVLSACETALGDVKGSEGVFGLQRAFKMAGVKKMIVSLWQVPDKETAELMTSFYSYWMKGKTINDAFAQAQADMRKKYSPFYWAAFVLVE